MTDRTAGAGAVWLSNARMERASEYFIKSRANISGLHKDQDNLFTAIYWSSLYLQPIHYNLRGEYFSWEPALLLSTVKIFDHWNVICFREEGETRV